MSNHTDDQVSNYTRSKLIVGLLALLLLFSLVLCYFAWRTFGPGGGADGGADGGGEVSVAEVAGSEGDSAENGQAAGGEGAANTGENAVKPPQTLQAIAGDSTMKLAGISDPNVSLNATLNGTLVGTTTATPDGVWEVEFPKPPSGEYELVMQIVSADGSIPLASQRRPLVVPDAAGGMADAGGEAAAGGDAEAEAAAAAEQAAAEQAAADAAAAEAASTEGAATEDGGEAAADDSAAADAGESASTDGATAEDSGEAAADDGAAAGGEDTAESGADDGAAAGGEAVTSSGENAVLEGTAEGQPTMFRPLDFDQFVGGVLRVEGVGQPNSQVEILVNGADAQTVATDQFGNWAWVKDIRDAGTYAITAQNPGTSNSPGLSLTIPSNIQFATEANCAAGVAPFGEDRGNSYVVAPCEYLTLISNRTGVPYWRLLEANPGLVNRDYLSPGDVINLPSRP